MIDKPLDATYSLFLRIVNSCIADDVLFLSQNQQQSNHKDGGPQASTPDVALQSQMIQHRMRSTVDPPSHHQVSSMKQIVGTVLLGC